MTTTTGLTFTGSPTGSKIEFSGSKDDINDALATLRYRTTRAETVQFTASLTPPGLVYFPGNGHMYEVVANGSALSWDDAKVAAEGRTMNGATGYLATITSQAENDYLIGKLSGDGWFGASDATTEDDWQWVTGPEAGTSFWAGLGDGSPVGGLFSNWASGEPNNVGNEDCAEFYSGGGGWNDLPCGTAALSYYVVEYGTTGSLPVAPSTTSFNITTAFPTPVNVPIGDCLDLIDAAANSDDYRYDNLSLTANIDCTGETVEPMFSTDDPDFGPLSFRGTFDGNGYTISNLDIDENAFYTGLIAFTDHATITDITVSGTVKGGDYCVGGVVGQATNTTFTNVTSNMDVSSYGSSPYYIGGHVGCYYAKEGGTSTFTNNTANGTVTGYVYIGGAIGDMSVEDGSTFTVTGNHMAGTVDVADGYYLGALAGYAELSDEGSTLTASNNVTNGIDNSGSGGIGGLMGELYAYDGAVATLTANEINGDVKGESYLGGLIGELYAYDGSQVSISDTHFTHDVVADYGYAGGIAGDVGIEGSTSDTKFLLNNSSMTGDVTGDYYVGGLFGEIYNDYGAEDLKITNSHASGAVTSTDGYTGGLVGESYGLAVEDSYATGDVTGDGTIGGLIGYSYQSDIHQSYATGDVVSTSGNVGGLVGTYEGDAQITESYATGAVDGPYYTGGLVGYLGQDSTTLNSYARGSATGDTSVGGLAGYCSEGNIQKSYSTGAVTGTSDTGGLLGADDNCATVTDSFWDTATSALSSSAGAATGKSTSEMKSVNTFIDTNTAGLANAWDFTDVWGILSGANDGYPCLQWQSGCTASEDGDGISDAVENAAPNSGDANDDSIPDSLQANVASFVNTETNGYAVVALDSGCSLATASTEAESTNAIADSGFEYPNGFTHFAADCGTPGYTTTVKIYQYGVRSSDLVLRKFNPAANAYFAVPGATLTEATIGGETVTVATYQIEDGGILDTDGAVNGAIIDPVGLGVSAVGVPNTGLGPRRE